MDLLANLSFYAFCAVWVIGSFAVKRTKWALPGPALILHGCILSVAIVLFFPAVQRGVLGWRALPDRRWLDNISDAMHIVGFGFAIWARFYIGRNWSAGVTLKEGHSLARGGPYALVRHPIYAGILLAILGKALGQGKVGGLLAFVILLVEWKRKSLIEEGLMVQQFGGEYERYRGEVKGLVPGVW
jgi:protein-S-isoprenylcysteine O-methyltransferase Ste14